MPSNALKALVTCEINDSFRSAMKDRNINIQVGGWGQTGDVLSPDTLVEQAKDCEIVIVEIEDLSSQVLQQLPSLKFIGVSRGTPVNVDLRYCAEKNIPVVHTPGRNADSVADYCLAMMLDLSRKLTASSRHLGNKGWLFEDKLPYLEFRGRELSTLNVGLYGYGQIGAQVAKRLNDGFGSNVFFYDPYVESSIHAKKVKTLDDLFEVSDIVSLHAPVTAETENSVNRDLIKKLGSDGILISSARAKLIVEDDLYQSLLLNEIASASIDVFWKEPIEVNDKWLQLSNVICTPHIAGASLNVVSNHCETILNGIDKWLSSNQNQGGPT